MSERSALTRLTGTGTGECGEKDCPNVYRDETDGGIVVQGDQCAAFQPPAGEALVKIAPACRPQPLPCWPLARALASMSSSLPRAPANTGTMWPRLWLRR